MIKIRRLNENIDNNKLCWLHMFNDNPGLETDEIFHIGESQKLSNIEIDILDEQTNLIINSYMKPFMNANTYHRNGNINIQACKLPDYYYFVDIEFGGGYISSLMCDTIEGLKLIHKTFLENYDKN